MQLGVIYIADKMDSNCAVHLYHHAYFEIYNGITDLERGFIAA